MDTYQLVAVLGELGSVSDSPPPHCRAAQAPWQWLGGERQLQGSSVPLLRAHPPLSEPRKTGEGQIFVNDQMPCDFNSCGPGLTSERYLVLRDLLGFNSEGTAQVSRPLALPVVRDFKSGVNRAEAEGLARAV